MPVILSPTGSDNGDGTFTFMGNWDETGLWTLDWNFMVDDDPFINGNWTLRNMTGSTQTYLLTTTLPVSLSIVAPSLMGGSTGGSLTDANFDGVGTVDLAMGMPFYNGMIDGVAELPINPTPPDPPWNVPFQGGTANIPATNVGLPGPTLPGPDVSTNIGIEHRFTLTAGDSVAITSFFVVVPEPSTLALLCLGGLALVRRRR
jgi:hypothetical protein